MNKISFNIGDAFFTNDDLFPREPSSVGDLIRAIVNNSVRFAGLIFVILLVVGGFLVITGAGQGDQKRIGQGRTAVTAAVAGFILIFTSYWIVRIIEVITAIDILR